jgi:hypothetical protein
MYHATEARLRRVHGPRKCVQKQRCESDGAFFPSLPSDNIVYTPALVAMGNISHHFPIAVGDVATGTRLRLVHDPLRCVQNQRWESDGAFFPSLPSDNIVDTPALEAMGDISHHFPIAV